MKIWQPINKMPYPYGMKVRCYPSYERLQMIKLDYDSQRFFYNYLTRIDRDYYHLKLSCTKGYLGATGFVNAKHILAYTKATLKYVESITVAKAKHFFLNNNQIDSLCFQHAGVNHRTAWKNFRNGDQGVPVFHKKDRYHWSYQTSAVYRKQHGKHIGSVRILDRKHVVLPKLGRIRTSKIPKKVYNLYKAGHIRLGSVKVQKDNLDQCYISFQIASEVPFVKLSKRSNEIAQMGYDLNTSNYLVGNDTAWVSNPLYYEHEEHRMKKLQRCLSRKHRRAKGHSLVTRSNYQKNRIKLAKAEKHVKNQRFNFLQCLSTELIKNQDLLAGENLKSGNMLRNHRIAKAIQSVGWREFISMLEYKAKKYHKLYVLVNPAYTTQRCSKCGYVMKGCFKLGLGDRTWQCPNCGAFHVRDRNAAVNILDKARNLLMNLRSINIKDKFSKASKKAPVTLYFPDKIKNVRIATNGRKKTWVTYLVTSFLRGDRLIQVSFTSAGSPLGRYYQ